jgi:NADP-dependent 3-hydroxy acid dehydrogenase YdfG
MDIQNKVALVTGAGKGIGRATALELARAGANIVATSRTTTDLQSLARAVGDLGRKVLPVDGDISRESFIKNLMQMAGAKFGGIDILINNAGIGRFGRVAEISTQDWDAMFDVNLRSMFIVIREALPLLKKNRESVVVNISSLAGKNFFTGGAGYAATKWGVMALSKCLMLEERDAGVRVMTVCPGSVDTHFFNHPSLPKPNRDNIVKPEDVASTIVSAILLPQRATISEIEVRPTSP